MSTFHPTPPPPFPRRFKLHFRILSRSAQNSQKMNPNPINRTVTNLLSPIKLSPFNYKSTFELLKKCVRTLSIRTLFVLSYKLNSSKDTPPVDPPTSPVVMLNCSSMRPKLRSFRILFLSSASNCEIYLLLIKRPILTKL